MGFQYLAKIDIWNDVNSRSRETVRLLMFPRH